MTRPSWTHMSSQRGFRIGASCQTSFGACLTDGEQTDVSLASHAARVASFVHCRTRGCEAYLFTILSRSTPLLHSHPVSLFLHSFLFSILYNFWFNTHILESNISARREIEENAQVELHFYLTLPKYFMNLNGSRLFLS